MLERFQHTNAGVPYVVYLFDPSGSPVHRVRSIDPNTSSGAAVFVQDTAVYDGQGLLHADIDTLTGGFNGGHLDPVGYQGQSGNYTDTETLHAAAGLYTALSGPGGAVYYDPLTGVGMARSRADGVNAYADALNPLAGWSWGSYFHEAGQFGIGEGKGFVNFASGSVVYGSPELQMADAQTGGHLSSPLAASGESQSDGAGAADKIALVGSFFTGEGEAVAVEGGAAKILAGTESRAAASPEYILNSVPRRTWIRNSNGAKGKPEVQAQNQGIADVLEQRGWIVTHKNGGGTLGKEEYFPGPGPGRTGSFQADITATKNGRTLRVNTVSTRADGKTPTTTEAASAAGIRRHRYMKPGDHLLLIPKWKL